MFGYPEEDVRISGVKLVRYWERDDPHYGVITFRIPEVA
jgi:hypothetical protein